MMIALKCSAILADPTKNRLSSGFFLLFLIQRLNRLKVANEVRSDRIGNMEHLEAAFSSSLAIGFPSDNI